MTGFLLGAGIAIFTFSLFALSSKRRVWNDILILVALIAAIGCIGAATAIGDEIDFDPMRVAPQIEARPLSFAPMRCVKQAAAPQTLIEAYSPPWCVPCAAAKKRLGVGNDHTRINWISREEDFPSWIKTEAKSRGYPIFYLPGARKFTWGAERTIGELEQIAKPEK